MAPLKQFLWVEAYRPQTIDDCILPKDIKNTAKAFVAQGDLPNMILAGPPGTGKTTLAMAMCRELGVTTMFINASEESGIDVLRTKIKDFAAALSLDGKRKYVILDEADFLNPNSTQPGLRAMMEEFAVNCGFLLTCNYGEKIIPALHSRCASISLAIPQKERVALKTQTLDRLKKMLDTERIAYDEDVLVNVIKANWPDLRKMITLIQIASANGELSPSVLAQHGDIQFDGLWKAIRSRNYKDARTWIGQNADVNPAKFYRSVFDWLHETAEENTLPTLIVLTADYQYRHITAVDSQVHLSAYVLELMNHGQYK